MVAMVPSGTLVDTAEWREMEFLSPHPDPRHALMAYLRREFDGPKHVREDRNGVFQVPEPMFPSGDIVRYYRTLPRPETGDAT